MISKAAIGQLEAEGWKVRRIFDGPPASGKTTRARMLVSRLKSDGHEVIHEQTDDGDIVLARRPRASAKSNNKTQVS
ncbi:hypothetical protein [Chelatococcus asaccharovorans]|uniref:Thymidylate kinase n=1 Tax=Chelatococcus asaccharovorans TaxID=28210 RepID=A0A2V3UDF1_9HYPH|nr:hypothetical protein [Chelatococcus asaccharovorans]MBS7703196.1 hypothetical protein [Chelatococcus asaccharovorans]PXW61526.1 hypothetical protein C7450_10341 [Chelatococcus asaccharovorans]